MFDTLPQPRSTGLHMYVVSFLSQFDRLTGIDSSAGNQQDYLDSLVVKDALIRKKVFGFHSLNLQLGLESLF